MIFNLKMAEICWPPQRWHGNATSGVFQYFFYSTKGIKAIKNLKSSGTSYRWVPCQPNLSRQKGFYIIAYAYISMILSLLQCFFYDRSANFWQCRDVLGIFSNVHTKLSILLDYLRVERPSGHAVTLHYWSSTVLQVP